MFSRNRGTFCFHLQGIISRAWEEITGAGVNGASEIVRDTMRGVSVLSVSKCGVQVKTLVWRERCDKKFRLGNLRTKITGYWFRFWTENRYGS